MARLGPFEPAPRLAVAVSGGADSMALAVLAADWVRDVGGTLRGLVVDHGLRPESGAEAVLTADRLARLGISADLLTIANLAHGPGLAERARAARYAALEAACADQGILHLLLGHHAVDQVVTVAMRRQRGSGPAGLAGMAAVSETGRVRLLRPLLDVAPAALRDLLRSRGVDWVEDPSNANLAAERNSLRAALGDEAATAPAAIAEAAAFGMARAEANARRAAWLAAHVAFRPEGFALLQPGRTDIDALAAVLRAVAGRIHPPDRADVAALARAIDAGGPAATLGGTLARPAGRLAPGAWLITREPALVAAPIPCIDGAHWDGRFRIAGTPRRPLTLGPLGADAARLRRHSPLPSDILRALPALRDGADLVAVPHLLYGVAVHDLGVILVHDPGQPASAAPFGNMTSRS